MNFNNRDKVIPLKKFIKSFIYIVRELGIFNYKIGIFSILEIELVLTI